MKNHTAVKIDIRRVKTGSVWRRSFRYDRHKFRVTLRMTSALSHDLSIDRYPLFF